MVEHVGLMNGWFLMLVNKCQQLMLVNDTVDNGGLVNNVTAMVASLADGNW